VEENGTKRRRPCSASSCASPLRPVRAETPPAIRRGQTVRALFLAAASMLGAEQREQTKTQ